MTVTSRGKRGKVNVRGFGFDRRYVLRTVTDLTHNWDGSESGYVMLNGKEVFVKRIRYGKVWRPVA